MGQDWRYGPAFRISLTYLIAAAFWISVSDTLLNIFFDTPHETYQIQMIKGMSFVLVTTLLLYILVRYAWRVQQHADQKYRELFYDNPHPMWVYDTETLLFLAVNDAAIAQYGYSRDEFLAMSITDIRLPEDVPSLMNRLPVSDIKFARHDRLWRHLRKDGTVIWVEIYSSAIIWEGHPARVAHAKDITEQKNAEELLKQEHDLLQSVFDHIPIMIAVFDHEQGGRLVNREWERITGWTQAETEGANLLDAMYPNKKERLRAMKFIRAALPYYWEEFKVTVKSGQTIDVAWTTIKLENDLRIALGREITEMKKAEAAKREAEWLMSELQKEKEMREMKNRFTAMVAHELRTPLTIIQNTSEILSRYEDRLSSEQKTQHFAKIHHSVAKMTKMTEQMLTINRLGARQVQFNPVRVDLIDFSRQTLDIFREMPDDPHRFVFAHSDNSEEALVDTEFLNHILTNLLSNAVKYSPDGGEIRLDVNIQDDELIFKVADQGIGIPELDLPYVFQPFRRAENVGQISGTGLGLAIVKDYVELYGGNILVESAEGRGTTFIVKLPKAPHQPSTASSSPATSNPA